MLKSKLSASVSTQDIESKHPKTFKRFTGQTSGFLPVFWLKKF